MPYSVYKNGQPIAVAPKMEIKDGGVLLLLDFTGSIDAAYAPGAWDSVIWEDGE